jgi:hypothetical protein
VRVRSLSARRQGNWSARIFEVYDIWYMLLWGPKMSRHVGVATIKAEILYFDGCPTYWVEEKTLREVLSAERVEAKVEMVMVNTNEEAEQLRFLGSPTVRVDGEDLFPVPEREGYALGCRTYITPEGFGGSPITGMLGAALEERRAARAGIGV